MVTTLLQFLLACSPAVVHTEPAVEPKIPDSPPSVADEEAAAIAEVWHHRNLVAVQKEQLAREVDALDQSCLRLEQVYLGAPRATIRWWDADPIEGELVECVRALAPVRSDPSYARRLLALHIPVSDYNLPFIYPGDDIPNRLHQSTKTALCRLEPQTWVGPVVGFKGTVPDEALRATLGRLAYGCRDEGGRRLTNVAPIRSALLDYGLAGYPHYDTARASVATEFAYRLYSPFVTDEELRKQADELLFLATKYAAASNDRGRAVALANEYLDSFPLGNYHADVERLLASEVPDQDP